MAEKIRESSAAHIGVVAARTEVDKITSGLRSAPLFEHGTLLVKFYAPRGHDAQTPHTRDEVYVIAQGRGTFFDGSERRPFVAGDMLFVAAGITHRFEQFSDDFGTWVMFYGPEGGEH
ncbi:MAG: cupin domain-containing protein [Burkholderiaceae bacterium]|nr:cupin domain-containing protein [Burkholderiaceae bacterium]